ncbi:---NA---, partial [Olea europaea subsp. europaea]
MGMVHKDLKSKNFLLSDEVQAFAHEGRLNMWMRRMGKRIEVSKYMDVKNGGEWDK